PAVRRRLRAGLPSAHHLGAAERARRVVLHAARRPRRQCLQALLIRHLPVLEVRRHLPAVERARDLRDAGPAGHPGHPAPRRRALLLDRADRAARRRALRTTAAALCDRTRLRAQIRLAARLLGRAQPRQGGGDPDRRQLPAVRAHELQPARRAAAHPPAGARRIDPWRLALHVRACPAGVREGSNPSASWPGSSWPSTPRATRRPLKTGGQNRLDRSKMTHSEPRGAQSTGILGNIDFENSLDIRTAVRPAFFGATHVAAEPNGLARYLRIATPP